MNVTSSFDFEGRWERHWTEPMAAPTLGADASESTAPARSRMYTLAAGRYSIADAPRREEHGCYVVEAQGSGLVRLTLTADDASRTHRLEIRRLSDDTLEIDGEVFTRVKDAHFE